MSDKELEDFAVRVFYSEELKPFFDMRGADALGAVRKAVKSVLKAQAAPTN